MEISYKIIILDSLTKIKEAYEYSKTLERINIFAFDTETNSKIDMSKQSTEGINILKDIPFVLTYGFEDRIYVADLENNDLRKLNLKLFRVFAKKAVFAIAWNIKFDLHMLKNIGFEYKYDNICDGMAIARLALPSKPQREGGPPMKLESLASQLLGRSSISSGIVLREELRKIWHRKLKYLHSQLSKYGFSRADINRKVKDVTFDIDTLQPEVRDIWKEWQENSYVTYRDVPRHILIEYAWNDTALILRMAPYLLGEVTDKEMLKILKKEMKLIKPLLHMERTGFKVDLDYVKDSKEKLITELITIRNKNTDILGIELTPNQHAEIKKNIKNVFNYDLKSTDKSKLEILMATDKTMPAPVKTYLQNNIKARTLEKYITTYINGIISKVSDGKVYAQFNSSGAVSGRFSSNFQQFPNNAIYSVSGKELFHPRRMFTIESDEYPYMLFIDYSQIELRIQAEYTHICTKGYGDINMLRAYIPFKCIEKDGKYYLKENPEKEWSPIDVHSQTTHTAFPELEIGSPEFMKMRKIGKRVNFAIIYGAGLNKLIEMLMDLEPSVVTKLYNGFHKAFKDIKDYTADVKKDYGLQGYTTNLYGRRYYIDDSRDVFKLSNYRIQGSAADVMKNVIIKLYDYIVANNLKTRLQATIHDEIIFQLHKDELHEIKNFKKIMEHHPTRLVPLTVDLEISTTNWAEKKDYKEVM